ncbi:hypothetical protein BDV96DRAFT_654498 [Lophiotrema nucula]|uniref:Uncharacterized protein n=1 Tax=Lophiotrema nucula TaxID=690887 RepID=A0A6A5YI47_9PLEO|nr:hypothetical protein BDV96DRAFT_654498 [Lophiotrema nucula]
MAPRLPQPLRWNTFLGLTYLCIGLFNDLAVIDVAVTKRMVRNEKEGTTACSEAATEFIRASGEDKGAEKIQEQVVLGI